MSGAAAAEAGRLQGIASDPRHSAFVSASAGSGKTKLLIDRVLRLMLPGADRAATAPDRIRCLTFTKAAAAEMAIRLRRRLGRWVALDDASLDAELASLCLPTTDAVRADARALFARVLDMPGGLRIGTIHAFCEQLLRRFPLEARISPHFRTVEETDGRAALALAREAAIGRDELADAVRRSAAIVAAREHAGLIETLRALADRLGDVASRTPEALAAALRTALGVAPDAADEPTLLAAAASGVDEGALWAALGLMETAGTKANREQAARFRDWLGRNAAGRAAGWDLWVALHCTDRGLPRQVIREGKFGAAHPEVAAAFRQEAERIAAVEDRRRALAVVDATVALLSLALPALALYGEAKEQGGLVDFDDLIRRTGRLLDDPGVAWVLFKLDGGLDHLLLDEVQDTSAVQWRIAGRLTEEFFAGAGAGGGEAGGARRTVFAVGDFKQSIYSFQGADPDAFHAWRGVFRRRAEAAGAGFAEPELGVSFRSAAPVLRFVDAVFTDPVARVGVAEAGRDVPQHRSSRDDVAGRVELWPLARDEAPGAGEAPARPWVPARRNRTGITGPQRLADALAARIRHDIERGLIRAGDVLVLVRRRAAFARLLVRALKVRDVPVAGLDRMVLTEQPAVVDLLALCDAVLLPDDDLALATVLTSPLGFTDDDGLTALALGRAAGDSLWDTLRRRADERADWARSLASIERLRARADWTAPHGFLAEALGPEGGRARLFARLGPEAGEAIDELLAAALDYAGRHAPSLGGFAHWVRRSGAEVKRETPEGADEVRLMTVHGAKGLEGRLVILADTTALPRDGDRLFWTEAPAPVLPLWVPGQGFRVEATERLRERARARALAEYNRLLYVALTRARDGLIVCGWAPGRGAVDPRSWYAHCSRAFDAIGATGATEAIGAPRMLGATGETGAIDASGAAGEIGTIDASRASDASDAFGAPRASGAPGPPGPAGVDPSGWEGEGRAFGDARIAPPPPARGQHALAMPAPVPRHLLEPLAPTDASVRRTLAPSRPENAILGPPPAALSPLASVRARRGAARAASRARGDALHALLQSLPALAPERRRSDGLAMAAALLGSADAGAAALVDEAFAVIGHPALAAVFAPGARAEQRVAGRVGAFTVDGVVDRMAIGADAVHLVDFKSGRAAPPSVERTPVHTLRQMAAYRAVLMALVPGRPVRCALVWTAEAAVVHLPAALLDRHAPGTIVPGGHAA